MKFKKIALVGVISLAAVVSTVGVVSAANGAKAVNQTQATQAEYQTVCNDQAKHSARGFESKGFSPLSSVAPLLGLQPQELKAELKAGKSLRDVASAKGIDNVKLAQGLEAALTAKIDQAVQNNKLKPEQATTIKAKLPQRVQAMLDKKWDGQKKGPGFHGTAKGNFKGINEQVQTLLGIDAATLKTEIQSGKSLVDIAQAKGVSKDALVAKIKSTLEANLDQAIKDQKLSTDKAAKIKENLPQKIESMVTKQHVQKQSQAKGDQSKTS